MTVAERQIVERLATVEPGTLLSVLAGCLASLVPPSLNRSAVSDAPVVEFDHRPGDDPYLITEEEFSYRARSMSYEEQAILRCRVNAARMIKAGEHDAARRQRQRADRLEKKFIAGQGAVSNMVSI